VSAPSTTRAARRSAARAHVVSDSMAVVWRNLLNIRRNPELLVFATVQPVIFVVMFRYVFGGAIQGSLPAGQTYINYLMPGVFVQTIVFGALTTGVGLADDLSKGLIDRFRSLPMARSAVLIGRTGADLVRNFFVVLLMCVVGFIVGWTVETSIWGLLGAFLVNPMVAGAATLVMILAAVYLLWLYQRVFTGELSPFLKGLGSKLTDVTPIEIATLAPLAAMIVAFGILPALLTGSFAPSVAQFLMYAAAGVAP